MIEKRQRGQILALLRRIPTTVLRAGCSRQCPPALKRKSKKRSHVTNKEIRSWQLCSQRPSECLCFVCDGKVPGPDPRNSGLNIVPSSDELCYQTRPLAAEATASSVGNEHVNNCLTAHLLFRAASSGNTPSSCTEPLRLTSNPRPPCRPSAHGLFSTGLLLVL